MSDHLSTKECIARVILRELKRAARHRGRINLDERLEGRPDQFAYRYLRVLLACKCGENHPDDSLKKLIDSFILEGWEFSDGLAITDRQAPLALHHLFFGKGSLDDRRNFIISAILEVENEDKDEPNYRKGYETGTFRRTKENELLLEFARYLTELLYQLVDRLNRELNDDDESAA